MNDDETPKTAYIEIFALNDRTKEAEYIGTVDDDRLERLKTVLADNLY